MYIFREDSGIALVVAPTGGYYSVSMPLKGQTSVGVEVGQVFGEWTVMETTRGTFGKAPCRCSCGREVEVNVKALIRGKSTRCVKCRHQKADATKRQPEPEPPLLGYHAPSVPDARPLEGVRRQLEAARHDCVDFDSAWTAAVSDSSGYRDALLNTEPDWRAAFEGAPPPPSSRAFSLLADD